MGQGSQSQSIMYNMPQTQSHFSQQIQPTMQLQPSHQSQDHQTHRYSNQEDFS